MLNHKGTQTLETPRLILRQAQKEDATPMFHNWCSDPDVTKFLTWPTYRKKEDAYPVLENWISEYQKENFYLWMIELKEIQEPIGTISVVRQREEIMQSEIGYCIGKQWWHQGIMTEALQAVINYLFWEVGMNRIEAKHDTNNPRSGSVMKKCGMRFEGISKASDRNNQGICDTAHYAILYSEWLKETQTRATAPEKTNSNKPNEISY